MCANWHKTRGILVYTKGILIGRFQPFHRGHHHLITEALRLCDELIIFIGSVKRPRTPKDPFTFEERRQMILDSLGEDDHEHLAEKVSIAGVEDTFYDDEQWVNSIRQTLDSFAKKEDSLALMGHRKDQTSYYLDLFPDIQLVEIENHQDINATNIREHYLAENLMKSPVATHLPESVLAYLKKFQQTPAFKALKAEADFIDQYKTSWSDAPWPPMFVTTDAFVLCQDHILLVKRGSHPGKGLWALPGGFLEPGEWIQDGLIRELSEETQIEVTEEDLFDALKTIEVFDHPGRSLIGRVVTHVGVFDLEHKTLPKVSANDDAVEAKWFTMNNFLNMSEKLHDDHYFIVKTLINPV